MLRVEQGAFDPAWAASGQLDAAVEHVRAWIGRRELPGARTDVIRLPGRSPLLDAHARQPQP
jgi:hypothetical protein